MVQCVEKNVLDNNVLILNNTPLKVNLRHRKSLEHRTKWEGEAYIRAS